MRLNQLNLQPGSLPMNNPALLIERAEILSKKLQFHGMKSEFRTTGKFTAVVVAGF